MDTLSLEEQEKLFIKKCALTLLAIGFCLVCSGVVIEVVFTKLYTCLTIEGVPCGFNGKPLPEDEYKKLTTFFYLVLNTVPSVFQITGVVVALLSYIFMMLDAVDRLCRRLMLVLKNKRQSQNVEGGNED